MTLFLYHLIKHSEGDMPKPHLSLLLCFSIFFIPLLIFFSPSPGLVSIWFFFQIAEEEMDGDLHHGNQAENNRVLQNFQRSFVQVQSLLDQNRLLINEINQNQASRTPVDVTRNVGLIRKLNNNIWRVVDLYADLSTSFTRSVEASSSEGDSAAGRAEGGKRVRHG